MFLRTPESDPSCCRCDLHRREGSMHTERRTLLKDVLPQLLGHKDLGRMLLPDQH